MYDPLAARDGFAAWRAMVRADWIADDPHFAGWVAQRPGLPEATAAFARECAGLIDEAAAHTNRDAHLPRLARWDGQGNRTEGIDFHPDYHRIGERVWGSGILSRYGTPGQEGETLALLYLLAQNGEGGHCCPLACTAGMIKILADAPDAPDEWRRRLLSPDYAERLHASQFLTEVQGGSDVGANALVARQDDAGAWRLHGEKWFCSVIDARLFLVTARPEGAPPGTGGLRAFVVPRERDGRPNGFAIRRLKDKLGTRSMASAEVDFEGAWAVPVGDFRKTVEIVLNTSRLYNAVCAAASLQRAWREADAYARTRLAFGSPILRFPAIARIVARLRVEAAAARASTFYLADLADALATGTAAADDALVFRVLVNLNKMWTAHTCPAGVRDAIEVLGGNGAIEEFSVLPRLLRDSIVLEAWEGGHGVLSAQILRDARKELHRPLFTRLHALAEGPERAAVDRIAARWEAVIHRDDADVVFRDVVEEARPVVQALLMRVQGVPSAWVEHFRVTTRRGWDPLEDAGLATRVAAVVG